MFAEGQICPFSQQPQREAFPSSPDPEGNWALGEWGECLRLPGECDPGPSDSCCSGLWAGELTAELGGRASSWARIPGLFYHCHWVRFHQHFVPKPRDQAHLPRPREGLFPFPSSIP